MIQGKRILYTVDWELKPISLVEHRNWDIRSVRTVCINHGLFIAGTNDEYSAMLDYVKRNEPTAENIFMVAKKICKHSIQQTVSNIMFLLAREACYTTFELDGKEDF